MLEIVIDVSAILVATIIFRVSFGALQNTFNCSAFGRDPYIASGISFSVKN